MYMNENKPHISLANAFGEEILKSKNNFNANASVSRNNEMYRTTTHLMHSDEQINKANDMKKNEYYKYKKLKESSKSLLNYDGYNTDCTLKPSWRPSTVNIDELRLSDNVLGYSKDVERNNNTVNNDPYIIESSLIMGKPLSKMDVRKERDFFRTSAAPIAMGRSGKRIEKGLSTSGLIGEPLMIENVDRSKNSLVQRTWLYTEDPALLYRINGVPKATMPSDVSLQVGQLSNEDPNAHFVKAGANYKRRQLITYDALSRGTKCGNVYMDDPSTN